jgi:hypothetical protein
MLAEARTPVVMPTRPPLPPAPIRLLIGPANFAGQGWAWSRAVTRNLADTSAQCMAVSKGKLDFPVDYEVPRETYLSSKWHRDQTRYVTRNYTHVLIEAARPILGSRPPHGERCTADLPRLERAGQRVALVAHGSDVRLPSAHAERYRWSPFSDSDWSVVRSLEYNAVRNRTLFQRHSGEIYVSTPDLLDDMPGAAWLPVVVDPERWLSTRQPMSRRRPVVVHAPSNPRIKGSDLIDPIMSRLDDQGLVEYRRIEGLQPSQMPAVYHDADIILDQFRLGSYGVAAVEGMAAGRVVIGHIVGPVAERVRRQSGLELPVVDADPDNLADVLGEILADRDRARAYARAGVDFVREVHDGRRSAHILAPFLGVDVEV